MNFINQWSHHTVERLSSNLNNVLGNHAIMQNEIIHETALYSILTTEWPAVKTTPS
jgi:hypothetical protein